MASEQVISNTNDYKNYLGLLLGSFPAIPMDRFAFFVFHGLLKTAVTKRSGKRYNYGKH